jgi:Protein of unknown function (DUF4235)
LNLVQASSTAPDRGSEGDFAGSARAVFHLPERGRLPAVQENPIVKRLMWSGLVAGLGAVAAIAANRVAAQVWRRVFDEDPPE